jgi:hypothetical protein
MIVADAAQRHAAPVLELAVGGDDDAAFAAVLVALLAGEVEQGHV